MQHLDQYLIEYIPSNVSALVYEYAADPCLLVDALMDAHIPSPLSALVVNYTADPQQRMNALAHTIRCALDEILAPAATHENMRFHHETMPRVLACITAFMEEDCGRTIIALNVHDYIAGIRFADMCGLDINIHVRGYRQLVNSMPPYEKMPRILGACIESTGTRDLVDEDGVVDIYYVGRDKIYVLGVDFCIDGWEDPDPCIRSWKAGPLKLLRHGDILCTGYHCPECDSDYGLFNSRRFEWFGNPAAAGREF